MNYEHVLETYPWLIQRNQNAIISFDTDGWASGVLLAHVLNWNIVGYYDSERLILKNGIRTDDCIFIDVEIFRSTKRSFGHHLIIYDFNNLPNDFAQRTRQCFNPNFVRRFDKRTTYTRKYPLATFHLLDKILRTSGIGSIDLTSDSALSVVWFIDGLMNIRYNYAPNVQEWITYLQMENEHWYSEMNARRKDDVQALAGTFISDVNGVYAYDGLKKLQNFSPEVLSNLIQMICAKLGIPNNILNWCTNDYSTMRFNRQFMDLITQNNFDSFWNSNPFSMSTYFKSKISFTLEQPQLLP